MVGVKKFIWQTAEDERTCPVCQPLDGKTFIVGKDPGPVAHPLCRCWSIPEIVEEGRFSKDRVYAELSEIVSGKKPGRRSDNEIIYVNLMGMAIEDIAVANMVYKIAVAHGIGHFLPVS
jgi:hypothetical protein